MRIICWLGLCVFSICAEAHGFLIKASPAAGETLDQTPQRIDLWFSEPVKNEYKALAVINESGRRVDRQDVQRDPADGTHLYASVPDLPAGEYLVRYRIVVLDSHIMIGKYLFTIKP